MGEHLSDPLPMRKVSLYAIGLFAGCFFLTLLTWLLAGKWFTKEWWGLLGAFVVLLGLSVRSGFSQITNALEQDVEAAVARVLAHFMCSPKTVLLLYFLPPLIGGIFTWTVSAYGLYQAAVHRADGHIARAYAVTFVTWLCWAAIAIPTSTFDKARLFAERSASAAAAAMRSQMVAVIVRRVHTAIFIQTLVLLVLLLGSLMYAVVFTESLQVRYYVAIVCVLGSFVANLIQAIIEFGVRSDAPPVLRPEDVSWSTPTGLLLRSFVDDDAGLGNELATMRFVGEQAIKLGALK